ncbi:hypothetical protein [Streptomyces sp. NPDC002763]|uniref:hypothetical protein n=1 Tax=Streptomyces sp. NPDC002763 TaxID=3154427 RepID=UPI003323D46C
MRRERRAGGEPDPACQGALRESYRVLAGVGPEARPAHRGARGTPHSAFNTGWRQLRIIVIYTPGGAELALREASDYHLLTPGAAPVWERAR